MIRTFPDTNPGRDHATTFTRKMRAQGLKVSMRTVARARKRTKSENRALEAQVKKALANNDPTEAMLLRMQPLPAHDVVEVAVFKH